MTPLRADCPAGFPLQVPKNVFVAKVTGSLVATQKVESMVGRRLLVVEPYRLDGQTRDRLVTTGRTFVAVDTVGAGDTFNAAFIHAFFNKTLPFERSLQFANAMAAASCENRGTELTAQVLARGEKLYQSVTG